MHVCFSRAADLPAADGDTEHVRGARSEHSLLSQNTRSGGQGALCAEKDEPNLGA